MTEPIPSEPTEESERGRAAIRAASTSVHAPDSLRAAVAVEHARRAPARRRRRRALIGGLTAGAAAATVALVAVLPGGEPGAPAIVQAAALAARPATQAAPAGPRASGLLAVAQSGVAFPDYVRRFGWRAAGARHDSVGGHATTTVFYTRHGRRLAYTILGGSYLEPPTGAQRATREGVRLWSLRSRGRTVVTWRRGGRTCVLAASGVGREELLYLAAWRSERGGAS